MQVVAVVFVNLNTTNGKLTVKNEAPYFYADPFNLQPDDLALVHNGRDFGVVRVVRQLSEPAAQQRVTKALLARIDYDESNQLSAREWLDTIQEQARQTRIQRTIDKQLETDPTNRDEEDY